MNQIERSGLMQSVTKAEPTVKQYQNHQHKIQATPSQSALHPQTQDNTATPLTEKLSSATTHSPEPS